MNRSKRQLTHKIQKKMAKTIRIAQGRYPVPEAHQYSDEMEIKELLKKFPKKKAKKYEELLKAAQERISIKKKKKMHQRIASKRTTPGLVDPDFSPPAHVHPEGKRWIKTIIKQNLAARTIQARKGGRSRKK